MAKIKIKTCESCLRSFRGRVDARTCSARCRQRLYRTASVVAKETQALEDKLKAVAHKAETELVLDKATESGFIAGTLPAPVNPLNIKPKNPFQKDSPPNRAPVNSPETLSPATSIPVNRINVVTPINESPPGNLPKIIKPDQPLSISKPIDAQKEFDEISYGSTGKAGKGLLKFMTAALVAIFLLGGILALLDFTGLLPTHYSQQISVNKLGDTVQNITNQVTQLHNQVTTLKGEAGKQGVDGTAGLQGEAGAKGAAGTAGPQGPAGDAGCVNSSCVSLQSSNQGVQEAGNINISGDVNVGGIYRLNGNQISLNDLADNVNIARLNGTGPQTFSGNNKFTGTILSANVFNTTNAFQVQNAAASAVFTVDTVNDGIAINKPSASYAIDVAGDVSVTGTYRVNGVALSSATLSDGSNLAKLNANQTFSGNNTFSSASNSFTGNGNGLTSLNASNLTSGTVADARLPATLVKLNANQTFTGYNTFQNSANSSTAFQIQNVAGNSNLFIADTASTRIAIGKATASYTLDVNGTISGTALLQNGSPVCDASGNCAGVGGQIGGFGTTGTIPVFTGSFDIGDSILTQAAGTVTAGGNFNVTGQYRVNGIQISSANLSNDASLAKLSANQTFSGNNTFSSASNSFTGNGAGLTSLNASNISGGTLGDSRLSSNVALLNGTGPQTFTGNNKFTGTVLSQNTANSAAAFQVQNASGNEVMTVDTNGGLVALGKANILSGGVLLYSSAGTGSITLQAANLGASSFNIALPAANGTICLTTGNCAGVGGVGDILNNGNSFSAPVTLGTNDSNSLIFETNNQNQVTIAVGGATTFKNSADSTGAFQIQNAAAASLLNADTTNSKITVSGNLIVTDITPTNPAVAAGSNQGGTLLGASATTYYYKITGLNSAGESIGSSEVSINGASFTPLTAPGALTAADSGVAGNVSCNNTAGQGCRYQVTFVTANGETTVGTTSTPLLNVASKQISLTSIPVGPTGTTQRKIYRSTNNSAFLLALTINDNSTVAATDNLAGPAGAVPGANTARTNLNNATISWTTNPGATSYRIYRGTAAGAENVYQTSASSPFTDTGAAGTAASPPARSAVAQFSVGNSTPGANLDVVGTTRIQAALATAAAFQIQGASAASILNLDTTNNSLTVNQGNFTVTGLANPAIPALASFNSAGTLGAGTYLYMLAASNVNGTTTAIASAPASVTTVGATNRNTLTWTAVPNAPGYNVYRSINAGVNWFVNSVPAGTTTINDNGTNFTWGSAATPPTINNTGGNLTSNGAALFKNLSNSLAAFQVQDATGANLIMGDTTNHFIGINNANPQATLDLLASSPSFYDGFETGALAPFTSSVVNGASNWAPSILTPHAGTYKVTTSSGLGCGFAAATLSITRTVNSPGIVSFWYQNSLLLFSNFIMRIDGANQLAISGSQGSWTFASFPTTAGTHTFTWVANCNNGNGGTYSLDDITITNSGAGTAAIFNGGNVGIGTTFPNASLEVAGTSLFHPASVDTTSLLQIQNAAGGALFNADTLNSIITVGQGNLLVTGLGVPAAPTLAAGSNQGGTLSGSAGTTYYYKVTAINTAGNETLASAETSFNGASFTPLAVPGAPTLALTAGVNLGIGTYRYKVTFVTANGETTGGTTAAVTTTAGNQAVNLTNVAVGPSGTTARKIYRTTVGAADGTQLLLTTINDNSTTIYSDTTADGGLGAALPGSNTARTNLNNVSVSFAVIPGAATYRVYRGTAPGGENAYQVSATSPFTDTGAAGTGASTPTSSSVERVGIGTTTPTANLTVAGTGLFKNALDTATAFQIQNAAGSSILGVDTVGAQTVLGKASVLNGSLAFNNSSNSNTVSIQSGITTSSYTLTLPTALPGTSACLQSNNTGTLSFTSCITGSSATLAASYANGAGPADSTISLDSTRLGVIIKDNSTPISGNLLTVQNSTATTNYFSVAASGVNIANLTAGSAIFKNASDSTASAFQIQNAAAATLLNADTLNSKISVAGNLIIADITPTSPAVAAGSNQGGTLSGAAVTTYFYKVTGLNSAGESVGSSEVSINGAGFTALTPPGALSAADSGTAGNVSCNNTAGQGCKYEVTFVTANGETTVGTASTSLLNVASKQITLTSIPTGPTGTTARKIYRSTNNSAFLLDLTINDNTTVTTTDNIAAPAGAIPGANTARTNLNNATVSWTANPGATSYRIYRGTTSGVENAYQTSASSPFTDTGAAGTAASPPARSVVAQLSIGNSTPAANLDVVGTTRIQAPTATAAAFQIQGASATSILNVDTTTNSLTVNQGNFTVTGLANPAIPVLTSSASGGTLAAATYLYMLAASNVNGTTTAIASAPASVTTGGSASQNTLTWTAVPNASGYNVYRSINAGASWFVNSVAAGTTSINDNGTNFAWGTAATPATANSTGGNLTVNGGVLFKNASNSATALRVQDASGLSLLAGDTTNRFIGINNANPQATLDVISSSPGFYDGFETGLLTPFTSTTWTITNSPVHTGSFTSGRAGAGTLSLTQTLNSAGTITFWARVTTLSGFNNTFAIDAVNQLSTLGTGAYIQYSFPVSSGTHTFTWTSSQSFNSFYLDDVSITNTGVGTAAIFNGGNVGIGTTFPNASLEVAGTTLFRPASVDIPSLVQIQNVAGGNLLNVDSTNSIITVGQGNLLITGLGVPAAPSVAAGSNQGGTLSGAAGTTYYYKVTAINSAGNETLASPETSFNGGSFTKLTTPGAPTLALTAGTNLGTGLYRYKVTFVTANGETTGGTTASITTTAGNQAINLTNIALGAAGTTARKIYRTTVGAADGTQLLLTTINDNATTIYSDTTADGGLGAALPGSNTATTDTNNATITFTVIPGAASYRIYRGTASGAQTAYQTTATSPFTDTGAAGTGASTPTVSSVERVGVGTGTPTANLDIRGNALFKNSIDSTTAFQVQNAAGTNLLVADTTNNKITITNLVVSISIIVNGHITTGNSSGSTTVAAGAAATCTTGSPTVNVTGNDTSGIVSITTATGCSPGTLATVTFANAFGSSPNVALTPNGANGATLQYYYNSNTATFDIKTGTGPVDTTTYTYSYHVLQ